MKIKLTVLICTVALLVGLLAGCGTETAEPVAEAETQPVVTTEPTEVTTEPTEPPTLFEELGIELWGGQTPSTDLDYWVYDVPAKTTGLWHFNSPVAYYSSTKQDFSEMLSSEVADTDTSVSIQVVPKEWITEAKPGEGEPYVSVANDFYNAYKLKEENPLSKDEWLEDHQLLRVSVFQDVHAARYYNNDSASLARGNRFWMAFIFGKLEVVDQYSGRCLSPTDANKGNRNTTSLFTTEKDGESYETMVQWELEMRWLDDHNGEQRQSLYLLVPHGYDGLAFCFKEYDSPWTTEDVLGVMNREEKEPWKNGNIADESDNIEIEERFFFALSSVE